MDTAEIEVFLVLAEELHFGRAAELDVLVNWLAVDEPDLTAGPAIAYQDRVLAVARDDPLAGLPGPSAGPWQANRGVSGSSGTRPGTGLSAR